MAGLGHFWPIRSFRPNWLGFLCTELPGILAQCSDVLSLRMIGIIQDRAWDWRRLDERIEDVSTDIRLVQLEPTCARLKTVPGARPITSSIMVAAIGTGDVFSKGRDTGSIRGLKRPRRVAPQRAGDRARQ
jgi:transposase